LRLTRSGQYTCVGSIYSLNNTLTTTEAYLLRVACKFSGS
jgi:hypothetical protein